MTCADVKELRELRVENETLKHRLRIHDTTVARMVQERIEKNRRIKELELIANGEAGICT